MSFFIAALDWVLASVGAVDTSKACDVTGKRVGPMQCQSGVMEEARGFVVYRPAALPLPVD